jgi:hypothetical protein
MTRGGSGQHILHLLGPGTNLLGPGTVRMFDLCVFMVGPVVLVWFLFLFFGQPDRSVGFRKETLSELSQAQVDR